MAKRTWRAAATPARIALVVGAAIVAAVGIACRSADPSRSLDTATPATGTTGLSPGGSVLLSTGSTSSTTTLSLPEPLPPGWFRSARDLYLASQARPSPDDCFPNKHFVAGAQVEVGDAEICGEFSMLVVDDPGQLQRHLDASRRIPMGGTSMAVFWAPGRNWIIVQECRSPTSCGIGSLAPAFVASEQVQSDVRDATTNGR